MTNSPNETQRVPRDQWCIAEGQVWAASIRESILLTNVAIVVRSSLSTPATRLMSAKAMFYQLPLAKATIL